MIQILSHPSVGLSFHLPLSIYTVHDDHELIGRFLQDAEAVT